MSWPVDKKEIGHSQPRNIIHGLILYKFAAGKRRKMPSSAFIIKLKEYTGTYGGIFIQKSSCSIGVFKKIFYEGPLIFL